MATTSTRNVPAWLAHALRWQRGPLPRGAVVRGALGAGLLLAVAGAAGRPTAGVVAGLGALLASVNDRPGTRRRAVAALGLPAAAGAAGFLLGTAAAPAPAAALTLGVTVLALFAGALSATGPVASAVGTQLLITAVIGAGMPLPESGPQRALLYLAGGGWLLALRLALPSASRRRLDFLDGERTAVAAAYDAVADLLLAAGGPHALAQRAALTAALDRAQDALAGPRLRPGPRGGAERRLHTRFAAVLPLAEAATALTWQRETVAERAAEGPRRLAAAVRADRRPAPLPAPVRGNPALRALDDALLQAAEAFGAPHSRDPAPHPRNPAPHLRPSASAPRPGLRRALGPAGREYGVRVALSTGASTAAAQALHPQHWYWLPVTAVFLVKPDLGPLASRAINRALGTIAGALVFVALAAVLPGGAWPYAVAVPCAALIPYATRHFAVQTGVVTMIVLAFVTVGGDPGAGLPRITDTLLACAIVLLVGHLPLPVRGDGIAARLTEAAAATDRYVGHVLHAPAADPDRRFALRRAAYRTLADARTAAELAAAELPPLARRSAGAARTVADLEHLVDTATATAVQLGHPGKDGGDAAGPGAAATLAGLVGGGLAAPRPSGTIGPVLSPTPRRAESS